MMTEQYAKTRILVADNSISSRVLLRGLMMQLLGIPAENILEAVDGEAVLAAVQTAAQEGAPFDALLLDLYMPNMSGQQVLAALNERGQKIPVLIVTSEPGEATHQQLRGAGATDVLVKPFEGGLLKLKLEAVLAGAS